VSLKQVERMENVNISKHEMRQSSVSGEWVMYAPERRIRPHAARDPLASTPPVPDRDPACPFCPGNERMLPAIRMEMHGVNGWQVRAVPNRYPALSRNGTVTETTVGIYRMMQGYGDHEVIVETPLHNRPVSLMSADEVELLTEAYHRRYCEMASRPEIKTVILFRNHGPMAGTSLAHPHSQLIGVGIIPQSVRRREQLAAAHFHDKGRCLFCDIVDFEIRDGRRIIFQNQAFIGIVPFAAEVSCEAWVVPKIHKSDFQAISDSEKSDLADALRAILSVMREKLNDPDYNYVIHSSLSPTVAPAALHWHLQIKPILTTPAGFEMGSEIHINPSLPESDATLLFYNPHLIQQRAENE
jgi:UDPglucose--hexose-1-phosphate uridylyltransferase